MSKDMVVAYLTVYEDENWPAKGSTLYWRWYHLSFLPRPGDRMVLWPHDMERDDWDPADGPMQTVEKVYWGDDGNARIQFQPIIVNPSSENQKRMRWDSLNDPTPWWPESGDIHVMLNDYPWPDSVTRWRRWKRN